MREGPSAIGGLVGQGMKLYEQRAGALFGMNDCMRCGMTVSVGDGPLLQMQRLRASNSKPRECGGAHCGNKEFKEMKLGITERDYVIDAYSS